ncbi:MAG: hypothetical protein BGN82_02250 [Alphaproteobacteria bacterium 65-7]|nr:MAG: hypothetical protein BGN82_02250 [Alphaproteobacteria bacterium 65-7]
MFPCRYFGIGKFQSGIVAKFHPASGAVGCHVADLEDFLSAGVDSQIEPFCALDPDFVPTAWVTLQTENFPVR